MEKCFKLCFAAFLYYIGAMNSSFNLLIFVTLTHKHVSNKSNCIFTWLELYKSSPLHPDLLIAVLETVETEPRFKPVFPTPLKCLLYKTLHPSLVLLPSSYHVCHCEVILLLFASVCVLFWR